MAERWLNNDFSTRLVTAFFFVASVTTCLYAFEWSLYLLFLVVAALCLWEFYTLTLTHAVRPLVQQFRVWMSLLFGLGPCLVSYLPPLWEMWGLPVPEWDDGKSLLIYSSSLLFLLFAFELLSDQRNPFRNLAFVVMGVFYIAIPFSLIPLLGALFEGHLPDLVFGIIALIWINDTGAYLVGSRYGRRLLIPRISPKKTVEGLLGGTGFTLVFAFVVYQVLGEVRLSDWLAIACITATFGPVGDLFESALKRRFRVKDSSRFLPGHGGFLDRFDSFIFVLPFASLFLILVTL